jgi:hypothetical protein
MGAVAAFFPGADLALKIDFENAIFSGIAEEDVPFLVYSGISRELGSFPSKSHDLPGTRISCRCCWESGSCAGNSQIATTSDATERRRRISMEF